MGAKAQRQDAHNRNQARDIALFCTMERDESAEFNVRKWKLQVQTPEVVSAYKGQRGKHVVLHNSHQQTRVDTESTTALD